MEWVLNLYCTHYRTQTHRRKAAILYWKQRLELCACKPRNTKDCQKQPEAVREIMTLLKPWFQTSGLQKCKRIHFSFESPCLWYFVIVVLGNEYRHCWFHFADEKTVSERWTTWSHKWGAISATRIYNLVVQQRPHELQQKSKIGSPHRWHQEHHVFFDTHRCKFMALII